MQPKSATLQGTLSCTIDASPNPVDAGAELTITARVVCDPPCDLTGDTLSIRDADGAELATITFTEFNDETFESAGTVSLVAPDTVGDYAWSAVIEAFSADDADFATVSVPLTFAVKAHTTRINVWDVPPAIGLGERFAIKVGVKCTCGCTLAGQPFTVHDDTGAEIAAGVLGADILPSTEALYFADAALIAPTRAPLGNHGWEVRFPAVNLSHAACGSNRAVRRDLRAGARAHRDGRGAGHRQPRASRRRDRRDAPLPRPDR